MCGCVATAGAQIMRYWRFPTGAVAAGFALAEGQTVSVLKNLPKGWKVKKSTDGKTLTIVKIKGVMIIVE